MKAQLGIKVHQQHSFATAPPPGHLPLSPQTGVQSQLQIATPVFGGTHARFLPSRRS